MSATIKRRDLLRMAALTSAAALLAACQPSGGARGAVEEPVIVTEGTDAVAAPKPPIKLVVSWWGGPTQDFAYNMSIDEYEDQNPHVSFERVGTPSGEYVTKILTMAGGGEAPDVILAENGSAIGSRFSSFAAYGLLAGLNDAAAQAGITKDQFMPGAWEASSLDGELYGIPYAANTMAMTYNADMFAEAGLPNPQELFDRGEWDWEHFMDTCIEMTKPDEKIYGIAPWRWASEEPFQWMFGGRYLSEDGQKAMLTDPKTIEGLEAFYDLTTKYKVAPPPSVAQGIGNMTGIFAAGQAAMMFQGNWDLLWGEQNLKFDYNYARFPEGPAGRYSWYFVGQWGMSAHTNHPEEAFEAVQALTSEEGMKMATIMKQGRTAARQEVTDRYYQPSWPGKNVNAFIDAFDVGRNRTFAGQMERIILAELDLVFEERKTVREAMEVAEPQLQAELDRGEEYIQTDMLKYRN